jgi:hypothetical protein
VIIKGRNEQRPLAPFPTVIIKGRNEKRPLAPFPTVIIKGRNGTASAKNNDGLTALMRAASEGLVNNVRALILAGADVNARDREGKTVWIHAMDNDHAPVLRLLRSYGADQTPEPPQEMTHR